MKDRCRWVLEQVYLFLDGEGLEASQRAEIEAHLEECGPCFERYGLEREVAQLVARLGPCRCPESLKNRVLQLLHQS